MLIMVITLHHYDIDEFSETINIEFSTKDDGDDFFRKDEIDVQTIKMYLPPHFNSIRAWVSDLDDETLMDGLNEYYLSNPLPEPQLL
jgi:hypothetical protein